ncbi:MAG: hypothetical protein IT384_10075 [Deltaproteobacteria bacterium]|nr:hypothetical protein [Deltaproteobacteria bacterium]
MKSSRLDSRGAHRMSKVRRALTPAQRELAILWARELDAGPDQIRRYGFSSRLEQGRKGLESLAKQTGLKFDRLLAIGRSGRDE